MTTGPESIAGLPTGPDCELSEELRRIWLPFISGSPTSSEERRIGQGLAFPSTAALVPRPPLGEDGTLQTGRTRSQDTGAGDIPPGRYL